MRLHRCIISKMRTTVTFDDDMYEAVQARARVGKRLGRVLSERARQALQPSGQRPKRLPVQKVSRFPVFEVPAGTRMIPASYIQKVLDEEGVVEA